MAHDAEVSTRRIDDALSHLVEALLPAIPDEDEVEADERHDHAFFRAKESLTALQTSGTVLDLRGTGDLVKKKLLREYSSPDKAVRFTKLYSRLLTLPVLSQRGAILSLLLQLSQSPHTTSPSPEPPSRLAQTGEIYEGMSSSIGSTNGPGARRDALRPSDDRRHSPVASSVVSREKHESEKSPQVDAKQNAPAISEAALLRDVPFTLQGVSSTNLVFTSDGCLKLPSNLLPPVISLLHTLAEPSLLFRGLSAFVQSSDGGLVAQSMRSAIGAELRTYLGLVATLEGRIRGALASMTEADGQKGGRSAAVTLKRCVVWTTEGTMTLRLMSLIVEESKSKRGGQLISMIHSFSASHGDPFVGAFAERLLAPVTRPFYDMLRQWIYDGELSDPHLEFFVSEQHSAPTVDRNGEVRSRGGATSVWEDKYKLDNDMIPSIITQDFAKKIFLIGKSLNFIRYGCGDSAWVEAYSKEASKELRYGDTATLEASIDEAYKTTMARLTHLMSTKFMLLDHLRALKKYLLLGQGDFVALLMESLSSSLDRPANTLFRHSLTAQLEHAIRGSNAQYDSPDVLRRLDARMLMQGHGDIGWDCFTLEYKIDAPIDVIVTPDGSRSYLKVFNFLWRVKRVEFALGSTWRRCMTGARGVLGAVDDVVGTHWKKARCAIAEMIHFVDQLQYYILFEVIESSWDQLQLALGKPDATLDDLIDAHAVYLRAITHKGLLGSSSRGGSVLPKEDSYLNQLHAILKTMLAYKDAVDGLYSFSVAEFTRRQDVAARFESRTAAGRWGISDADELDTPPTTSYGRGSPDDDDGGDNSNSEDHMLPALATRLATLSADFRVKLNVLLGDLAYQPDVDMRFLGVVMNFNDVYEPVRRSRRGRVDAAGGVVAKTGKPPRLGGGGGGVAAGTSLAGNSSGQH
ncbi:MAG: hypothetical protein M1825_004004 [Sarcosagium campestre]|nr:MAG: hypothetical protein M1825_004004 [Sarcosagium campestre]